MPKVSVVVPVYNVEKYIHKCLDSLVNQTLEDIEIILIDDESPDNCGKICDEYAKNDKRIKVIHKKNGGVSSARNDGIKNATSDWVMFADSDDWCEETMCEIAYENAIKNDADVAIFNNYRNYEDYEKINEIGLKGKIFDKYEEIEKLQMSILYDRFMNQIDSKLEQYTDIGSPWSKIFRKDFLEKNNIEFNLKVKGVFDDALFCMETMEKANKVFFKNEPIYHYRILNDSLTNAFKSDRIQIYNIIYKEIELFMDKAQKKDNFREAYYARIIVNLCKLLKIYYFHPSNSDKLSKRLKELKKLLKSKPYDEAIENIKYSSLRKNLRVYLWIFKTKSPVLVWGFYKINLIRKKIFNKN